MAKYKRSKRSARGRGAVGKIRQDGDRGVLRKGHSSDSNPVLRKHRHAAAALKIQSTLGSVPDADGAASITADVRNLDMEESVAGDCRRSVAESRASAFTTCTNQTFDQAHITWKPGSSEHNEVLAVLAAVTDVVRKAGGVENDLEYFYVLLSALSDATGSAMAASADGQTPQNEHRINAIAHLLSMCIGNVSDAVLQAQFAVASEVFFKLLSSHAATDQLENFPLLRRLIVCIGVLLYAQPASAFAAASSRSMVNALVALLTHDNAGIRKSAREQLTALLSQSFAVRLASTLTVEEEQAQAKRRLHPCASLIADSCAHFIEKHGDSKPTLRLLPFFERTLEHMPAVSYKQITETIFRLMTLSSGHTKQAAMKTLRVAMQARPDVSSLPVDMNGQIVVALYDFEPNVADVAVYTGWLQALTETTVCFAVKEQSSKSDTMLSRCWAKVIGCFEEGNAQLGKMAVDCAETIIVCCADPDNSISDTTNNSLLARLDKAVNLQSVNQWPMVFQVIGRFFVRFKSRCAGLDAFASILKNLADIHESENCGQNAALEKTVGVAVREVGIPSVVKVLPLQINPNSSVMPLDVARSWLLPLLHRNPPQAEHGQLRFFFDTLFPLAIKLEQRIETWKQEPMQKSFVTIYSTVLAQIWDLLPTCCVNTPDELVDCFPKYAQLLGVALLEKPSCRLTIMAAVRSLLNSADGHQSAMLCMAKFAKNYLPILFTLYTGAAVADVPSNYDDKGVRLAALETIRQYVAIAPNNNLAEYVTSAEGKLAEAESGDTRARIFDIVIALVPHLSSDGIELVFERIIKQNNDQLFSGGNIEKKLCVLLSAAAEGNKEFLNRNREQLLALVTANLETCKPESRPYNIATLISLVDGCEEEQQLKNIVDPLFTKVILQLHRRASLKLQKRVVSFLLKVVAKWLTLSPSDPSSVLASIMERIQSVVPEIQSSDIIEDEEVAGAVCTTLIVFLRQYGREIDTATMYLVTGSWCAYLMRDDRGFVRTSMLKLLKAAVGVLPPFLITQLEASLCDAALGSANPSSRSRIAGVNLIVALIHQFGAETVGKYAHSKVARKQMRNLAKRLRRKDRKEHSGAADVPSSKGDYLDVGDGKSVASTKVDTIAALLMDSDEEEADDNGSTRTKRSTKKHNVWLRNDSNADGGEVLDLLERRMLATTVTTINPGTTVLGGAGKTKDINRGFKTTTDGRLVINNDDAPAQEADDETTDSKIPVRGKRTAAPESYSTSDLNDIKRTKLDMPAPNGGRMNGSKKTGGGNKRTTGGDAQKKGHLLPYAYLKLGRSKKNKGQLRGDLNKIMKRKKGRKA